MTRHPAPAPRHHEDTSGAGRSSWLVRLWARWRDPRGSMTVLTTGVLVVILMVIGVGTAITGVHLERNGLQAAADSAALTASQALDPSRLYGSAEGEALHVRFAGRAAREHLRQYPLETTNTEDVRIADVSVDGDGTVRVVVTGRTHPPLAGWFTRRTGLSVPLTVHGEARSR